MHYDAGSGRLPTAANARIDSNRLKAKRTALDFYIAGVLDVPPFAELAHWSRKPDTPHVESSKALAGFAGRAIEGGRGGPPYSGVCCAWR